MNYSPTDGPSLVLAERSSVYLLRPRLKVHLNRLFDLEGARHGLCLTG